MNDLRTVVVAALTIVTVAAAHAQDRNAAGKAVFDKACALCHAAGIAGAPKLGSAADWEKRLRGGVGPLYRSALQGTPNGMPAKGGQLALSETDVRAAVDYMVAAAGGVKAEAPAERRAAPAPKPIATPAVAEKKPAAPVVSAPAAPPTERLVVADAAPAAVASDHDPNAFNRLLPPPAARNPPPLLDGIHDPANPGTVALQAPLASFDRLPRANAGNRVDWVAALGRQQLNPRWDIADAKALPMVMDLNIVREVKGSMPDVVYPHKQHTEWLDCSNCHPAIFIPQKGANQISMASILLGQQCGVCHGKVAFPVSECRLCHSKKKDAPRAAQAGAVTEVRK